MPRILGGGGGARVIVTKQLASYLEDYRLRVSEIDLPCGTTTIKRLRKLLGHNWSNDALDWWLDRIEDLGTMTIEEFAERHDVSSGAVSTNRQALLGSLQRPFGWWRDPRCGQSCPVAPALGDHRRSFRYSRELRRTVANYTA